MSENDTIENEILAPECVAMLEEAAAYALGECALSAPARLHMLKCPSCREKLTQYQAARMRLPFALPQVEPPSELRARLLDTVGHEEAAKVRPAQSAPAKPAVENGNFQQRKPMPAWGLIVSLATALSLMLMLITWNVLLQSQLTRQTQQMVNSRES